MLYLYAITDTRSITGLLPPGVADSTPELFPFNAGSAVVARLRSAPARDVVTARRHMDVLTALMAYGTVLPVRFGTMYDGHDDLNGVMAEMGDAIAADLRRLQGHMELGLTVTDCGAHVVPAEVLLPDSPGARYIAAKRVEAASRLAWERANEALATRICAVDGAFADLAEETGWRAAPQHPSSAEERPSSISIAFLIATARLGAFRAALARLRAAEPHMEFLCTGPWPPFSFVRALERNPAPTSASQHRLRA